MVKKKKWEKAMYDLNPRIVRVRLPLFYACQHFAAIEVGNPIFYIAVTLIINMEKKQTKKNICTS